MVRSMGNENEFDRLIDEGVRQYVNAEPSLGLENRVLATLEEKRRPAWWRRWWVIAVPAMAALALVIGIAMSRKPAPAPVVADGPSKSVVPSTTMPPVVAANPQTSKQPQPSGPPSRRPYERIPARAMVVKETRATQFPSPVEATEQEKILAQLARRGRAPVAVAEVHPPPAKDVDVPPIEISEVQIKALPDPNNGQ